MLKRWVPLCCLLLAGCSTHPVAGFLDYAFPGKVRVDPRTPPHGGVCLPQGAAPGPGLPFAPVAPVPAAPPGPPVFPGAAPAAPGVIPPPSPPPPVR